MDIFVTDEGEKEICSLIAAATPKMGLFKNNHTVTDTTVIGDLTDADFSGYTAGGQSLAYGSPATQGGGEAKMTAAELTYSHNGGGTANTIYGGYIYFPGSGKLLKAWNFDAPITMAAGTDVIKLTESHLEKGTIS